jgi:general secretion pathway protein B
MSYILDALRRADAERERGGVPGIHAQRFAQDDAQEAEPRSRVRPVVWLAGGGLACLLAGGALAWYLLRSEPPASPRPSVRGVVTGEAPAPAVAMAPSRPAPRPGASVATASPSAAPAPPAEPARTAVDTSRPVAAAPAPRSAQPAPKPAPQRGTPGQDEAPRAARTAPAKPPIAADSPREPRPPAAAPGSPPAGRAPATAPPTAAPGAPSGQPRVVAQSELPADIRRQLPTLTIGGSIYSQDRANRFLIVNGQVFHEGSQPSPGLVIEQIGLKSAVLRFKDYRYSISY